MSPDDRFTRTRIKAFGPVWEAKLAELMETGGTGRGIARQLQVDVNTVRSFSRRRHPTAQLEVKRAGVSQTLLTRDTDEHRRLWLHHQNAHPTLGVKALRQAVPKVYAWLYRHDRGWLVNNSPTRLRPPVRTRSRVDWPARDVHYAERVKEAAAKMRARPGRPKRITASALAQEAGAKGLIQRKRSKLPETAFQLAQAVESREQFALRRVTWAVDQLRRSGAAPREWEIVRLAGVRPDLLLVPSIRAAIGAALT